MSTSGAWDSAASTGFTLSNGDKTGTGQGVGGSVYSTDTHSTGKWYAEITTSTVKTGDDLVIVLSADFSGFIFLDDAGTWNTNTSSGSVSGFVSGSVVGIALNITNNNVWFRTGAGNWNNSGTANPATNVGGIAIGSSATPYQLAFGDSSVAGAVATLNTGTSAFANAAPSGFSNWFGSPGGTAYTLTAATGSVALSGVAATLRAARKIAPTVKAFALTGIAAGLKHGYTLTAAKGTFSLTGVAAGLRRDLRLTTAVGSVALVGNAANLVAARRLTAGLGTVALTGVSAGLVVGRKLPAGTGAFTLTGYAAGLTVSGGYTLSAGTGAFVLTGNDAGLVYTPATNTYRPDPGGKSSRSDPRRKSRREQSRKRNEELTRQLAPAPPPDAPLVPVTRKAVKAALALPIATGWLLEDARQALPAYVPLIVGAEQYRAAAGVANASAAAAALAVAQYLARLRLEEEDEEDVMLLLSIAA